MGEDGDFCARYGPWALIAGASDGTGREFARQIAARGVHCILIARRASALATLAAEIEHDWGVSCVIAAIDLASPDATKQIVEAIGDRQVGLFVANAGADSNGAHFLDRGVDVWHSLAQRNVMTMMDCTHHFGGVMRQRKQGGLLIVGSAACWGGAPYVAAYSATKAFQLCLAESLWAELQPYGVDVLHFVLSATDTPALRALLSEKGLPIFAGLADPVQVAAEGLARLPHGPVHNWGQADSEVAGPPNSPAARRERILMKGEANKKIFG